MPGVTSALCNTAGHPTCFCGTHLHSSDWTNFQKPSNHHGQIERSQARLYAPGDERMSLIPRGTYRLVRMYCAGMVYYGSHKVRTLAIFDDAHEDRRRSEQD